MSFLPSPEHLRTLSGTEYHILEFVVKNQEKVLDMTVQELSDTMYVSTASIMRFCKKLGFSGFSEFKFHLKREVSAKIIATSKLSVEDMKQSMLSDLEKTNSFIDAHTLETVVSLLTADKNIHFFAKGITTCVFSYFQKYLLTLGKHSTIYGDTHIAYLGVERMTEQDVFIVASLSGLTAQVIKAAQIAKANGATIIAFSKMNNNPLSAIAHHSFYVPSEDVVYGGLDTQSRINMFFIVDLIIKKYVASLN